MVWESLLAEKLLDAFARPVGRVVNSALESEPVEKKMLKKIDFRKIINDRIGKGEFPEIMGSDIDAICTIVQNSEDVYSVLRQLYVYEGSPKTLEEIKEDFVSLFPEELPLKVEESKLKGEKRQAFLLKVFDVLDHGILVSLNGVKTKDLGAKDALDNRRYIDLIGGQSRGQGSPAFETVKSLFILYSPANDVSFADKLSTELKDLGFYVQQGGTAAECREAVENSEIVLAVIGPDAAKDDSFKASVEHALGFGRELVPLLYRGDESLLPPGCPEEKLIDFRDDESFEEAFEELLQILDTPLGPLLTSVPSIPSNFLPRPENMIQLKKLLLSEAGQPVIITSKQKAIALKGMGGIGKSVLASVFTLSTETRKAFPDGIFWLTIGIEANPVQEMKWVGTKLGDDPAEYEGRKNAESSLSSQLSDKRCLLVLDDVWKVGDAEPFVNSLGPQCRLLITTREKKIVTSLSAREHSLDILDEDGALRLLANWCGVDPESLPSEAAAVAEECGYLPLALALCGAQISSGITWTDILEALQEADLSYLESDILNYSHASVMKAQDVSVRFLSKDPTVDPSTACRYLELAVFPSDEQVPEAAAQTLWSHTGRLKPRKARKLLNDLENKSLLSLEGEAPDRLISLHDLQCDYLKASAADLPALHSQILEAYREGCGAKWSDGPQDGYFFEHLAYHLKKAGKEAELRELLLNFEWMRTKLDRVCIGEGKPDVNALLQDYTYLSDDSETELVKGAVQLSSGALARNKSQLAGHLLGRLLDFGTCSIKSLLKQTSGYRENCIRLLPRFACLKPPGGPLIRNLEGHGSWVNAVALTPDGRVAVSASNDQTLKVWDLEKGEETATLRGHGGSVRAVALTPDGRVAVSASNDQTVKVWDLEKGEETATLRGHGAWVSAVALTPDGRVAVSASDDQTLKVWDLEKGEETATLRGHGGSVSAVALTPDGRVAVSASNDQTLKVWDLEKGEIISEFKGDSSFTCCKISTDGKTVVAGDTSGRVHVLQVEK